MTRATGAVYTVHFRRRREGKTDYVKRLALVKGGKTRLVVRKTNRSIIAQFVNYSEKGDVTVASATSKDLQKHGFVGKCNSPSAYLTGLLAGRKALKTGLKEFILDAGMQSATKGSVVFAVLKGAVDAGLKTNFGEEKMPSQDRMSGKHLNIDNGAFENARSKISSV
ncbi:MAG: 50S ribosomal protein L18 [Candidatus Micrarchaeota archaeon]